MTDSGTLAYILNSLAWSFVGAAAVVIYRRMGERRPMATSGDPENKRRPRFNWVLVVALVILVFSVLSTVVSWNTDKHQRDFVACQARVNQARTDALNELFLIGAQDRMAVDHLVAAVTVSSSREETRVAFAEYRATRDRLERERKEHPLPQPENLCGQPPV